MRAQDPDLLLLHFGDQGEGAPTACRCSWKPESTRAFGEQNLSQATRPQLALPFQAEPGAEPGHFGVCVDSLTSDKVSVPVVLEKLLEHVEMHGLYTEGLYRKSGAAHRTRELRQALQTGGRACHGALVGSGWGQGSRRVLFRYHGSSSAPLPWPTDPTAVQLENFPIHAVTGVLKQWLRELPEPLMTFAQYSDFLRAVGEEGCCPGGGWGIPGGPGLGGRVTWWMPGPHGHWPTPRTAREGGAAGGDLLRTGAPARGQPQVPGTPDLPPSQASASCGEARCWGGGGAGGGAGATLGLESP